jgi:hypothetical protein
MAAESISNADLDRWIADLMECKTLSEADVKRLCDKVHANFLKFFFNERGGCRLQ